MWKWRLLRFYNFFTDLKIIIDIGVNHGYNKIQEGIKESKQHKTL